MIVRPVPSEIAAKNIAAGKAHPVHGVSASWYEKGGLEWDGQQLLLLDADGEPHAIPAPPNGALVRTISIFVEQGARTEVPDLFVGDESKHMVAHLPVHGFEQVDLSGLASAAGLQFLQIRHAASDPNLVSGGYPSSDATINLKKCSRSEDEHRGLGGLFRRRGNSG
jgi:hypothetical protein